MLSTRGVNPSTKEGFTYLALLLVPTPLPSEPLTARPIIYPNTRTAKKDGLRHEVTKGHKSASPLKQTVNRTNLAPAPRQNRTLRQEAQNIVYIFYLTLTLHIYMSSLQPPFAFLHFPTLQRKSSPYI